MDEDYVAAIFSPADRAQGRAFIFEDPNDLKAAVKALTHILATRPADPSDPDGEPQAVADQLLNEPDDVTDMDDAKVLDQLLDTSVDARILVAQKEAIFECIANNILDRRVARHKQRETKHLSFKTKEGVPKADAGCQMCAKIGKFLPWCVTSQGDKINICTACWRRHERPKLFDELVHKKKKELEKLLAEETVLPDRTFVCGLCNVQVNGCFGHHPAPLRAMGGEVCDACYIHEVVPERLKPTFPCTKCKEIGRGDGHDGTKLGLKGKVYHRLSVLTLQVCDDCADVLKKRQADELVAKMSKSNIK